MLGTIPPAVLVSPNIAGRPLLPPPPFASFLSFLSSFLRLRLSRLDDDEEEEEEDDLEEDREEEEEEEELCFRLLFFFLASLPRPRLLPPPRLFLRSREGLLLRDRPRL